jgi:hypothetical protein
VDKIYLFSTGQKIAKAKVLFLLTLLLLQELQAEHIEFLNLKICMNTLMTLMCFYYCHES